MEGVWYSRFIYMREREREREVSPNNAVITSGEIHPPPPPPPPPPFPSELKPAELIKETLLNNSRIVK